jgi:tetratricopeptide (TPR) repeat protein
VGAWFGRVSLALASTILCLAALEGGVRGYRSRGPGLDPVELAAVGPASDARELLHELSDGEPITEETFNIYYFGGSTMASGRFIALIGRTAGSQIHGKPIRALRVATDAQDLAFNHARLETIVTRRELFRPDLCVFYSGHNEFLKFHGPGSGVVLGKAYRGRWARVAARSALARELLDRLGSYELEIDERRLVDEPLFDAAGYAAVIEAYGLRLEAIAARLSEAGIPLLISTVVGNYADFEPNRSLSCHGLAPQAIEHRMREGRELQERGDWRAASGTYGELLRLCPQFAEAHYRLGQCREALGAHEEAWLSFLDAVAQDGMPIRALPSQNERIRELGRSGRAHVVDAVEALHLASPEGRIGFNLMVDGHHPNERGYAIIAELMATKILEISSVPSAQLDVPDERELEAHFGWRRRVKSYRRSVDTARWFTRLATWRYDPAVRLQKAEELFREARRLNPRSHEPQLGMAIVHYLRREPARADRLLAAAAKRNPAAVSRYLEKAWVAGVVRRGRRGLPEDATGPPGDDSGRLGVR